MDEEGRLSRIYYQESPETLQAFDKELQSSRCRDFKAFLSRVSWCDGRKSNAKNYAENFNKLAGIMKKVKGEYIMKDNHFLILKNTTP